MFLKSQPSFEAGGSAKSPASPGQATLLHIDRVTKHYAGASAVSNLTLDVRTGETLGLLGPNGAGKSTLMHLIAGVLLPDGGSITLQGTRHPHSAAGRATIGLVPQNLAIYPNLTAAENLRFFGRLYGLRSAQLDERVRWGLGIADLAARSAHRAGNFSGGMLRRLNLACALLHEPELLLLDEPTVGVDPQARNHIYETITELKATGMTIVHSTHMMEEAERLCDRVAIMDHGQILAVDSVAGLIDAHAGLARQRAKIARAGASHAPEPNLESVFLRLTGKALRD